MRKQKRYRGMKCGEIIEKTDEYISVFTPGQWSIVKECSIGKELLDCNVKYYRRPLKLKAVNNVVL